MSKHKLMVLMGAVCWLGASASMASINDECASPTEHAYEICEGITIMRQEMAEYGKPPEPFVDTVLGSYGEEDYGDPASRGTDSILDNIGLPLAP